MENRDQNQQREEQEDDQPDEKFSDEEILNKIDKDAAEEPEGEWLAYYRRGALLYLHRFFEL